MPINRRDYFALHNFGIANSRSATSKTASSPARFLAKTKSLATWTCPINSYSRSGDRSPYGRAKRVTSAQAASLLVASLRAAETCWASSCSAISWFAELQNSDPCPGPQTGYPQNISASRTTLTVPGGVEANPVGITMRVGSAGYSSGTVAPGGIATPPCSKSRKNRRPLSLTRSH